MKSINKRHLTILNSKEYPVTQMFSEGPVLANECTN